MSGSTDLLTRMRHMADEETPNGVRSFVQDDVKALIRESEGWKKAFAAQSRKVQAVLHVPGVKEIINSLEWNE